MGLFGYSKEDYERSMTALGHGLVSQSEISEGGISDQKMDIATNIQWMFSKEIMKTDSHKEGLKEILLETIEMNSAFSNEEKQHMISEGLQSLIAPVSSRKLRKDICIYSAMFHLADPGKTPDQLMLLTHICAHILGEVTQPEMAEILNNADKNLKKLGIDVQL